MVNLRSSSQHKAGLAPAFLSRTYSYIRLMQVSIRNSYYNASGYLCPDFTLRPTTDSAALMASLGLLFKDEGSGFSVLFDTNRSQELLTWLRTGGDHSTAGGGLPGVWNRLSFTLAVQSPNFFNVTNVPINLRPGQKAFFLSNMAATVSADGRVLLNPEFPDKTPPVSLTGSQYMVEVPGSDVTTILVRDISGAIVACEPVYWPRGATADPNCQGLYWIEPPVGNPPLDMVKRDPIYLDFSLLPEDKYQIQRVTGPGTSAGSTSSASTEETIYAYSASPLIFVDLLFTNPGIEGGVYPVGDLDQPNTSIVPVQYYLEFERRSTIWNYYIVPTSQPLTNLRIDTGGTVNFAGPKDVTLPGNQAASLFVSGSPIALQEQSDSDFKLLGKAGGVRMKNGVLLDRLPVASSQQVIPGDADFATESTAAPDSVAHSPPGETCFSDIYVYV